MSEAERVLSSLVKDFDEGRIFPDDLGVDLLDKLKGVLRGKFEPSAKMWLVPSYTTRVHISHFHEKVSAYHCNREMVGILADDIRSAMDKAEETGESVIVDQDCLEHVFIVHPRKGAISLYRCVGSFDIVEE